MYEIGKFMGCGASGAFFRIKGHRRLGVKIRFDNSKHLLREEAAKAQVLRKHGVPIPKNVGVVKVKIPDNFNLTLNKKIMARRHFSNNAFLIEMAYSNLAKLPGTVKYGLVIEIIENDLNVTNLRRRTARYYFEKEKKKIESLGIKMSRDVNPYYNVLWSPIKKKLYFIDVEHWEIPLKLFK